MYQCQSYEICVPPEGSYYEGIVLIVRDVRIRCMLHDLCSLLQGSQQKLQTFWEKTISMHITFYLRNLRIVLRALTYFQESISLRQFRAEN